MTTRGLFDYALGGYFYTANTHKSVGDPLDKYLSLRPLWDRARAMIQGQRFAKQFDSFVDTRSFNNLLLPFSPSMTQRQYDFYRAEAELPGLTSQYARALIGGLLRKGVSLTLPDDAPEGAREWILNEFTADNKSMHAFLDDALWEEIQTSRAWIYVDYPTVTRELTVEEQSKIRPYPVLLRAESVINWRTGIHPLTGQEALMMFITRSYVQKFDENEFHPRYVDTVKVHNIMPDGLLQIRVYERNNEDEEQVPIINGEIQQYYDVVGGGYTNSNNDGNFTLVNTIEDLYMNGERMTMIPAFPFNSMVEAQEPMLQPLIDREVGLYNKISRRNHLLYGAATYTPVVASDMSDEEFENLVSSGLGSWLRVRADENITALETPTDALSDMETAITNTIEEMARMGIRLLNPEGNNNTSGVALEIRNAAQTGQLGNLNIKLSKSMEEVIAFMMNWRYGTQYNTGDIDFMLSGDFNPAPLGSDWMRLVTEWYQAGIIPRTAFVEIAKQNDILPNDYDDSTGVQELEGDDLIVPVREQFDVDNEFKEAEVAAKEEAAKARGTTPGGTTMKPMRERTKPVNDGSSSPQR